MTFLIQIAVAMFAAKKQQPNNTSVVCAVQQKSLFLFFHVRFVVPLSQQTAAALKQV